MQDRLALRLALEEFYATEVDLLDRRAFEPWLDLFAEDLVYRVPMVQNRQYKAINVEYLTERLEVSWFDEDKETLRTRVAQIRTGAHWAEEPLSRTTHLVTNILVAEADPLVVRMKFLVQRGRNDDEEHTLVGTREDHLTRDGDTFRVARRTIYLTQTVLRTPTLSFFL